MSRLIAPILPSRGLAFVEEDVFVIAATANNVVRGQVLEIDVAHTSSGTTTDNIGGTTDAYSRAIEPQETFGGRIIVVAMENARIGQLLKARVRGIAEILINGTFERGQYIILGVVAGTQGKRIYGILLESGGQADTATRARVLWDGEVGFASLVAAEVPGGDPEFPVAGDIDIYDPNPENPGPDGPEGGDTNPTVPAVGVGVAVAIN